MSSRYQQQFSIPDGFPALLKDFTREILRNQYFAEKRSQGMVETKKEEPLEVAADEKPHSALDRAIGAVNYQELSEAVYGLFKESDDNGNGTLDRQEFASVLQHNRLGLSTQIVDRILAEADDNEDGVIEYTEFVPILMDIIAIDKSAREAAKKAQELVEAMRGNMHEFLLYGVPRTELEKILNRVFQQADSENLGYLNRSEFKQCLQSSELSLTRKDINLLLSKVDTDGEGRIAYRQFIPTCFNILVERFADQVITSSVLESEDGMRAAIMQCFTEFDVEGKGELTARNVKHALQKFSDDVVPLTVYQIHTIVSVVPVNDKGIIKYNLLVPIVESTVHAITDLQYMKTRFYVIEQLAQSELLTDLSQTDPDKFRDMLRDVFQRADVHNVGTLTGRQVSNALRDLAESTGHSLRLEPAVWQSLLAVVDADDNGNVEWNELVQFMGEVFRHIEREKTLQAALQKADSSGRLGTPAAEDTAPAMDTDAPAADAVPTAAAGDLAADAVPDIAHDGAADGESAAAADDVPVVAVHMRQSRDVVRVQLNTDG